MKRYVRVRRHHPSAGGGDGYDEYHKIPKPMPPPRGAAVFPAAIFGDQRKTASGRVGTEEASIWV